MSLRTADGRPPTDVTTTGCYLDAARGHYIHRDVIYLATELGFIVDPFASYVLARYDADSHLDSYPSEQVYELATDAHEWLNSRCGHGRIPGQNFPPETPRGTRWEWYEGDFGLYMVDDEGEVACIDITPDTDGLRAYIEHVRQTDPAQADALYRAAFPGQES